MSEHTAGALQQGRPFRPSTGFYIAPSGPSELPSRWVWWVSARVRARLGLRLLDFAGPGCSCDVLPDGAGGG
jgi:hypothetical protein